jgi:hypothetical protein
MNGSMPEASWNALEGDSRRGGKAEEAPGL